MIGLLPDRLRVVRRVRAEREDVFDAWVNPRRLRAWFGPVGATVVAVTEIELEHTGVQTDQQRKTIASGWTARFASLDGSLNEVV
jgi:hypothetical protein